MAAKPVADTGHGDAEGHLAGGAGVGLGVLARFPCLAGDDGELLAVEVLGLVEGDEVAGEPAPVEVLRATLSNCCAPRARARSRQHPHVCWTEWSMAEGDRIDDRKVWVRCNPAYPARISMEYIRREFLALGPDQFTRERIGRSSWPASQTGRFAVISREAWEACQDAETDARAVGKVSFGVAVSGIRNRPSCQITAMTGR